MNNLIIGEHYGLHTDVKGVDLPRGLMASMNAVGIEVEMENASDAPIVKGWFKVGDASLRNNGIEYVLSGPQCGVYLENSIRNLGRLEEKLEPDLNERCSTHVHLDFSNNTLKEVGNFAMLFAIYEDVLFSMCDPSRLNNPYCVPVSGSSVLRNFVRQAHDGERSALASMAMSTGYRYGSINFSPLSSFGSVEVRMKEGVVNEDELKRWVNTLLYMKEHAIKCDNVIEEFKKNPNAFTVRTFPLAPLPEQYLYSKMAVKTLELLEPYFTKAVVDKSRGRNLNWTWTPDGTEGARETSSAPTDSRRDAPRPEGFFNTPIHRWHVRCPDGVVRIIVADDERSAIELAAVLHPAELPYAEQPVQNTFIHITDEITLSEDFYDDE